MINRGQMYLVLAQRRDGQWIHYRTCDETEARRIAAALGTQVELSPA